jgi:endonuclease-8
MPEGDTLWRTAEALRPRLLNRRIERAEPAALHRLQGSTVTEVRSLGKNLLISFDSGHTLRTHMRMTGAWYVFAPGQAWRRSARPPSAVLETEGAVAVLFNAPTVELTRTGEERIGELGPDLLAASPDLDQIVRRARSLPGETPIGELLLDQRVASGIGNIHRCELLWAARIDPWCPQRELDNAALRQLYAMAQKGLTRGAQSGGLHKHAVHRHAGRPCPRCGTPIRLRSQGNLARATYWCPACQVRPRPSS